MKTSPTLTLTGVGLFLVALAAGCGRETPSAPAVSTPLPPSALAKLTEPKGTVTLERKGEKTALGQATDLVADDAVETGDDSSAVLQFPDGKSVEIGSDARFTLGQDSHGLVLKIDRGLVLTRVPEAGAAGGHATVALTILTPFGLTRIGGAASQLSFSVLPDGAKVEVKVGTIQLVSKDGSATTLLAGQNFTLGQANAAPTVRLHTLVVTLSGAGGQTEIKAKGARGWKKVGARSVTVTAGDQLRVKRGSSRLALGERGAAVELLAGANIKLGPTQGDDATEQTELDLSRGGLRLDVPRGHTTQVALGPDSALTSSTGGDFSVIREKHALLVEAHLGDAQVTQGGVTEKVEAGQRLRFEHGKAKVESSLAPGAVLPARGMSTVFHPGLSDMALGWAGGRGDYVVEVSTSADFSHPIVSGLVHRPQASIPVPRRGTLHWRITRPDGAVVAKGGGRFGPEPVTRELARLRNEVPEGSETTTIYFQDKPPAVTFTYPHEPSAANYKVSVYRADQLDQPVTERLVETDRAALEAGVLSEGKYLWSVTPLSKTGQPIHGGKMSKLEMVYDNSVPTLLVFSPKNGEGVHGGRVRATGVAPVGFDLSINGKPAPLDEKHRFDEQVAVTGQPPVVVFRLTKVAGADAVTVRVLKSR